MNSLHLQYASSSSSSIDQCRSTLIGSDCDRSRSFTSISTKLLSLVSSRLVLCCSSVFCCCCTGICHILVQYFTIPQCDQQSLDVHYFASYVASRLMHKFNRLTQFDFNLITCVHFRSAALRSSIRIALYAKRFSVKVRWIYVRCLYPFEALICPSCTVLFANGPIRMCLCLRVCLPLCLLNNNSPMSV